MKMLFEACHNYATTKDGSYFKLLREATKGSHLKIAGSFTNLGADWQPSPADIEDLEAGRIESWFPCLSQSVIKVYDVGVFLFHKISTADCEVAPHMVEAEEKLLEEECKTLGFEFAKQQCRSGASLYCITDPATRLYYCHMEIESIKSAIIAAKKEQAAQVALQPKAKKPKAVTPAQFDPFDL